MRETDERVTCECGRWRWAGAVDGWVEQYHHRHIAVRGHESFYCWDCHTELTVAEDGTPVAEAMVPADETLAESIARQQADPEKGGLAAVVGTWPGDESDAEIEEALAAMRGRAPDDEYHECAGYGFDVHAYIRESLSEAARLRRELAEYREAYRDADDGCRKLEAEVARLHRLAGQPEVAAHLEAGLAGEDWQIRETVSMGEKVLSGHVTGRGFVQAANRVDLLAAMVGMCMKQDDDLPPGSPAERGAP